MTRTTWPALRRNLVAILRGVTPDEVEGIAESLLDAGFEAIEIPLNSPRPFDSISRVVRLAPKGTLIGAGTVLTPEDVSRLSDIGGSLLVSPNVDIEVLTRADELGIVSMPGVFTPTEAFTALRHGAAALKFFPASALGAGGISAMRAVLPADTVIGAVGGVDETSFAPYRAAGVTAFGLGSSLYKPGFSAQDVATRARCAIEAYDAD